jgi:tetratricopeptide (TPR) repeat protein
MLRAAFALAIVGLTAVPALGVRDDPKSSSSAPKAPASPEEIASAALESGLKRLADADSAEAKAASASKPSSAERARKQAQAEYQRALKDFERAVSLSPDLYRAHNGIGYAHRKLGDYGRALESHDRALSLAPDFPDAIEYRAEAYLGLNRLDEAKQAYMQLFVANRPKADVLMKAMRSWIDQRRTGGTTDPAALSAFDQWTRERSALAAKTVAMTHNTPDWK